MSKQKKKKKESTSKEDMAERSRDIWLAGLGALSAVEEEGSKLFKKLVDRGSDFEKKRKELFEKKAEEVSEQYQKMGKTVEQAFEGAEGTMEGQFRKVVTRLGLPTSNEMEELSKKIDVLTEKVEEMQKKKAASSSATKKTSPKTGKGRKKQDSGKTPARKKADKK